MSILQEQPSQMTTVPDGSLGGGSTELLGEANGQECGHGASLDGIQGLYLPSQQSAAKYGKE